MTVRRGLRLPLPLLVPLLLVLVLVLGCLAPTVDSKRVVGTVGLTSETCEQFVAKFSFSRDVQGVAEGAFESLGRYRDGHEHSLAVGFYDDAAWETYQAMLKKGSLCRERAKLATASMPLHARRTPIGGGGSSGGSGGSGAEAYEFRLKQRFQQRQQSHYYYVVISDCDLEFYPAHVPVMSFELHLMNGKSELPADEDGLLVPIIHHLPFLAWTCLDLPRLPTAPIPL